MNLDNYFRQGNPEKMTAFDKVFELIAEHTTDLVCIHDSENTIRFATPSSKAILGYEPSEIIGKKLTDYLSADFIDEMDFTTLKRFFDHPEARIRYQVEHGEGRLRWLETTFTYFGRDPQKDYALLTSTRDITESVHLTDDLMEALSKEQEISRFKSNLYSIASHEFKTPLAVIQANIEMLRIKRGERILENALGSIEEEVDRLNSMIADMLELKKLTTGQTTFRPEWVDLLELTEEVLEQNIRKAFPDMKIMLKSKGRREKVKADYTLLRFVIGNLLGNACKFSNQKGKVHVNIIYDKKMVDVVVQDYGIGIPEEEHSSIFKSFYRAKNVGNVQGTGVGLAIVKEFVDLHKGKVGLVSNPGKGSTFTVSLPK
ncbi:MAG: PAS domain-containing sensor histidine kinase [Owenweeksia sp.]